MSLVDQIRAKRAARDAILRLAGRKPQLSDPSLVEPPVKIWDLWTDELKLKEKLSVYDSVHSQLHDPDIISPGYGFDSWGSGVWDDLWTHTGTASAHTTSPRSSPNCVYAQAAFETITITSSRFWDAQLTSRNYEAHVWTRDCLAAVGTARVKLSIAFYDALHGGALLSTLASSFISANTTSTWTKATYSLTSGDTPVGAIGAELIITLRGGQPGLPDPFYVDDAGVELL